MRKLIFVLIVVFASCQKEYFTPFAFKSFEAARSTSLFEKGETLTFTNDSVFISGNGYRYHDYRTYIDLQIPGIDPCKARWNYYSDGKDFVLTICLSADRFEIVRLIYK